MLAVLIAGAVASMLLAQWAVVHKPSAAFFLLPTRTWELLLGALATLVRPTADRPVREVLSFGGLGMIAFAVLTFDRLTPTPGPYTLLPTLGAAAIMCFARTDTVVGRALSAKLPVGIGLVSYSIYLWHQPLFAFARMRSIEEPGPLVLAGLCLLTLALAYLTWKFVERPFRLRVRKRQVFGYSAAATIVTFAAGAIATIAVDRGQVATLTNGQCNVGVRDCFVIPGSAYSVALWGDSYADAFATALGKRLIREGISLHLFVANGCPSILGVRRNEPGLGGTVFAKQCEQHNAAALQEIRRLQVGQVVITSAYQGYMSSKNMHGEPTLIDPQRPGANPQEFLPQRMRETIQTLGTHVLVVLPHPTVENFPKARKELFFGLAKQIQADYAAATRAQRVMSSALDGADVQQVDGRALFCIKGACPVVTPAGSLLLYDGKHLSGELAERLADQVAREILAGRRPQG